MRTIELRLLSSLNAETQMQIRDIRNEDSVRSAMFTDHLIGKEEHTAWIKRLGLDDRQLVFAILEKDRAPLGVVSVNAIDRHHKKSDWAFYLTKSERGGFGAALEFSMIDFVFDILHLEKLNCEVIEGNNAVIKLHGKFLFKDEGFRESNIIKYGNRTGVHFMGLTTRKWADGRAAIVEKYGAVFDKFSITIIYSPTKADVSL